MKQCPQCQQSFSDEYSFCLSDGTRLEPIVIQAEIPTVVQPRAKPRSKGRSILIFVLAGLLSLSLGITAAVLYYFWPRRSVVTSNQTAPSTQENRGIGNVSPTPEGTATPAPTATPDRKSDRPPLEPDDLPDVPPPPALDSDPPPSRITFERGRSQTTISGSLMRQRSYLLYAAAGQELSARVDADENCVFFENGSSTVRYSTIQGDNVLTVVNDCDVPARFRLNVRIR